MIQCCLALLIILWMSTYLKFKIWRHRGWCQGDMRTVHHPEVTAPGTSTFSVFIKSPYTLHSLRIYEDIWVGARVIWGQCTTWSYFIRLMGTTRTGNHPGLKPRSIFPPQNSGLFRHVLLRVVDSWNYFTFEKKKSKTHRAMTRSLRHKIYQGHNGLWFVLDVN